MDSALKKEALSHDTYVKVDRSRFVSLSKNFHGKFDRFVN